jgi:hypothetical protein
MSNWPSAKAKKVLAGSHKTLEHADHPDYDDGEEIGPRMLSRIAKYTGLQPGDL